MVIFAALVTFSAETLSDWRYTADKRFLQQNNNWPWRICFFQCSSLLSAIWFLHLTAEALNIHIDVTYMEALLELLLTEPHVIAVHSLCPVALTLTHITFSCFETYWQLWHQSAKRQTSKHNVACQQQFTTIYSILWRYVHIPVCRVTQTNFYLW